MRARTARRRVAPLSLVLAAAACHPLELPRDVVWTDAELALIRSLCLDVDLPPSDSNAVADDSRAAALGQRLFFDAGLSADGTVACATCHKPSLYFTDGQPLAVGLARVERHTPSVIGAAWFPFLMWDGRKDSLWSQALGPLEAAAEMGGTRAAVARRVFERYREPWEDLWGPLPPLDDEARFPLGASSGTDAEDARARASSAMGPEDEEAVDRVFVGVGKCLEAYERKLLPRLAPFDRYAAALLAGDASGGGHLSPEAVRGLESFLGEAGCVDCHNGPLFTDFAFHNTGLPPAPGAEPDLGRASGVQLLLADPFRSDGRFSDSHINPELVFLNPEFVDFQGAFKTPSLRNVAETAPYGHSGQFRTLEDLLVFYRKLPRARFAGHRDLLLRPLRRSVSTTDLTAFLRSLTGELPDARWLSAPPE